MPVVLLGGLATYLTRYLPMAAAKWLTDGRLPPRLSRFLRALGPAAIAALLALSLAELLPAAHLPGAALAVLAGAGTVIIVHRLTGNPAWATLAGAVAYGLAAVFPGG